MFSARFFLVLLLVHVCTSFRYTSFRRGEGDSPHRNGAGRFRIIAGRPADITEFPYQASMEHYGQQWCGASILSKRVLVTAAHCVQPIKDRTKIPQSIMQIRVANSVSSYGGQTFKIDRVIPHERYNEDPAVDEHDIALIVLATPLKFSNKIQPIEYVRVEPLPGDSAWVTGFGRQDPMRRKAQSRHLMAVEIPIMDRNTCTKIHSKYGNIVTEKMVCAGNTSGHKDSCKGDSGGPLAVGNKLAGVVAWGIGCGREGIPGVYTNVATYADWIDDKLVKINQEYNDKSARSARRSLRRLS